MRSGMEVYRRLAGATALVAILLAGLAVAAIWQRAEGHSAVRLLVGTASSIAPAAERNSSSAPEHRAVHNSTSLKAHFQPAAPDHHPDSSAADSSSPAVNARAMQIYAALPLSFEANNGQTDSRVKFLAHGPGYTLFLTPQEAVLSLPDSSKLKTSPRPELPFPQSAADGLDKPQLQGTAHAVRVRFVSAGAPSAIAGRDPLPGKTNYFIGNDPKQWHTNVPNFSAVEYRNLYPGVDAVFHGDNQRLEFDFDIAPGANPKAIALEVDGARHLRLNRAGDLELNLGQSRAMVMGKPRIYQQTPEGPREIAGHYVLGAHNRIAFALDPYDRVQPLVIDPTLAYSTYLGGGNVTGAANDAGKAITVDSAGDVYVTGTTTSIDFPVTAGAFQPAYPDPGSTAGFVTELNPSGSALVYSTYFGDTSSGSTTVTAIALDASDDAYLTGYTNSNSFPTTPGAYKTSETASGTYAFATELNSTGTGLVYSTYLSGTETTGAHTTNGFGIAVDADDNAYVVGTTTSPTYPTTPGAFQTVQGCASSTTCGGTGFVTKVSSGGASLSYSTYLGTGSNKPAAVAVDSSGDAFVVGSTEASTFPVTPGAFQTSSSDPVGTVFVTKLNPDGTALTYSTFLSGTSGTSANEAFAVTVDASGYAYVTGQTSDSNFPTTQGAYQTNLLDAADAFITKLNITGSALVYSTYLPGHTTGYGIGVNSSGEAYVAGNNYGSAGTFPTTSDAFQPSPLTTTTNGFLTVFNSSGSSLVYSTYIEVPSGNEITYAYAVVVDSTGNAYVAGAAQPGFPTTPGAFKTTLTANANYPDPVNAFIMKFAFASPVLSINPTTLAAGTEGTPYSVAFSATGGTGTVTFAVTTGSLPAGITLASDGALSGTPTQTGTFPFTVTATDADNNTGTQTYSLVIACQAITVGPSTLDPGTSGTTYPAVTFTENGGVGTTSFSESGALPAGITFVSAVLSGTPTQTGSFSLRVTATDSNSCTGSVSDTLTINAATLPPASVTDNETIKVTDTETFPDVADSEKITVTDSEVVRAYTPITITPSPASFNTSNGTGYATHAFAQVPFSAMGGTGALTLSESGSLPAGITFTNGVLSGTPGSSAAGTYTFSVTATDALGDSATLQGYTLTILAASAFPAVVTDNESITVTDTETFPDVADSEQITVTDTDTVRAFNAIAITPSAATFNSSESTGLTGGIYGPVKFVASGGTGTLTLTESGTLPAGLSFNNGVLGGTLSSTSAGAYSFSVTATDVDSDQATQQGYTLTIAPPQITSLKISANPDSLTIAQGKTGTTTLTFTPSGGYAGELKLGCSGLPEYSLCVFSQNGLPIESVTLSGNNQPVSVQLTFVSDVSLLQARLESTSTSARRGAMTTAVAFWWPGSLIGFAVILRKRQVPAKSLRWFRPVLLVMLASSAMACLTGCILKGDHVTPVGTSRVTVSATPGSGPAQKLSINITVVK
jgi:Putative Ig domain/Beta-propeller repeat